MFLTQFLLKKAGWRPRSLSVPGRQWIGKNRRIRFVTKHMRKSQRQKASLVSHVESMIEFPYLTAEEAKISDEEQYKNEAESNNLKWQKRTLGHDIFGLGLGKPSVLDHLMVTDRKRYNKDGTVKTCT